ncbi:MAG: calcium-translocating P-type ATPase, PMCA-type [Clostridia bacterium]|nr:calcium-translocating P-type ATPase, PMCA-type [Clostridia bacterium]
MKHYLHSAQEVLQHVSSTPSGLSPQEASLRYEKNGPNKLDEAKKKSLVRRLLDQFADPMILILIAAAIISGVTAAIEGEFPTDVIIIMLVVIINAVLGVFQESKAEKAIEALQSMSAATSRVMRDGQVMRVKSTELVVGDVILLEAGDAAPADARILECASLQMEESALTGESVPVNKTADALSSQSGEITLGDRKNMVYMGSSCVYGRCTAVICATGMDTQMGAIAGAIANAQEGQTPLQKKLSQLSKILSFIVIGICVFIFAFGIIRSFVTTGAPELDFYLDTFMIAVSLAVAAIPEGLAAVVTIVLSMGVTKMAKRNAIIRKLTAVETLGCAQIICSDKTGTLTQNKMTVVDSFTADTDLLARGMSLCTDVALSDDGELVGEPTELALVNYALSLGINKNTLQSDTPRVGEAPFDSVRKRMSTVHKTADGFTAYTKGAPDEVLKCCEYYLENGTPVPMTEELRQRVLGQNKAYADRALRVLALAVRYSADMPDTSIDSLESGLTFVGLVGMIDPVRPEVKAAIEQCKSAGVRAVMITGDHKDTAVAIAKELGILSSGQGAITGAELDKLSDEEFEQRVEQISVYARVQPENKVRIVNAWRAKGKIVAMTGDGVNDAPSIKSADIGVGMGITGTDVTKNVADMVLADDNFATIVTAVGEGRRIYDNIRKAIQFLLSANLSEVVSIFVANLLGFTILKPVHLLWINLVTDTFPALALGVENAESGIMSRPPRKSNDGIFAGGMGVGVAYQGTVIALLTIAAYFVGHFMESGAWEIANSPDGMTMAFLTMSMCEIFHAFNMRSQHQSVVAMTLKGKHNKMIYASMLFSLVTTAAVIFIPFLANAFGFTTISLTEYLISMGIAFLIVPIVEVVKLIGRRKK